MTDTTATVTATGTIWHQGEDPVNSHMPAWRASHDDGDTVGIIRVGDSWTFEADGYTWEVSHDVFTWSGHEMTLEAAIDAATEMLTTAVHTLITEGY